ncbi:hypothetical protein V6N12_048917 [Hibiscus sabdariffa]|uniref:40S ribosomal protein S23 n=1 Tax=Hibiscus sabdariffa TaxID=183260 RepID=A0ABR2EJ22_9ROSI
MTLAFFFREDTRYGHKQRWADKAYKKSNLGNEWKKPFAGSSHAKGIVLEKIGIEAKQPTSAIRKCARVQLIKNGKKIAGCDEVLIAGFGRKGHAVGNIPGVRFKVVKAEVSPDRSLDALASTGPSVLCSTDGREKASTREHMDVEMSSGTYIAIAVIQGTMRETLHGNNLGSGSR